MLVAALKEKGMFLPVHIHGLPCDMDAISDIAQRRSLAVVEDAAQAHLATYKGRYAGTIGQAGAFSVQATKNLSGVEGGFVVSDDHEVAAAARRIRTYGEDIADGSDLAGWYFRPYTVFSVGWNYRSNELSAAFARSQLRRLDEYTAIAAVAVAAIPIVIGLVVRQNVTPTAPPPAPATPKPPSVP